jgi:hypothetical protein
MAATFEYAATVTATSVAATTTFGVAANYVKIINTGTSFVHTSFNGVTATTSASHELRNSEILELRAADLGGPIKSVSMRTPATNNATIRIFALGKGIST